jgi:hypothetical protein
MGKLIFAGLWACACTLVAVFFAIKLATAPPAPAEAEPRIANLELVSGESLTIPIIEDGKVTGYFLGRISFMMDKQKIEGLHLPMTQLMTDELFTVLVGDKMIDVGKINEFDVAGFRERLKTDLNKQLGGDFISEILVEQLDYLSKDDVKKKNEGNGQDKRTVTKIIDEPSPYAKGVQKEGH